MKRDIIIAVKDWSEIIWIPCFTAGQLGKEPGTAVYIIDVAPLAMLHKKMRIFRRGKICLQSIPSEPVDGILKHNRTNRTKRGRKQAKEKPSGKTK
ncbi:MAG: hypothetical protein K2K92_03365 [Duncaniella sp.]|nr:hypothetical protein [Duncaniella sp.]